jgi:hypothetical protein
MKQQSEYVTHEEYLDMSQHIAKAIHSLTDAVDGLRTVSLLTIAALEKQKSIDSAQLIKDISAMIEIHYPQDENIPITVLDFRAELIRRFEGKV